MPEIDSNRMAWESRMERLVKALLAIAFAGLIVTIANAAGSFRAKTLLEERVEILEAGRKDQQLRNLGQDELNDAFKDHLSHAHPNNPESR